MCGVSVRSYRLSSDLLTELDIIALPMTIVLWYFATGIVSKVLERLNGTHVVLNDGDCLSKLSASH